MANRCYFVANDNDIPAGPSEDDIHYDPDTEVLAAANYGIPVLWCSLFSGFDIRQHSIQGFSIPSPVTDTATACDRFFEHRRVLTAVLSQLSNAVEECC